MILIIVAVTDSITFEVARKRIAKPRVRAIALLERGKGVTSESGNRNAANTLNYKDFSLE